MLDYVSDDPSIREVILYSDDPLIVPDERLNSLVAKIEDIPPMKRLRIHTRLPLVIPQRITERLIEIFVNTHSNSVVIAHFNHLNEIDENVAVAFTSLNQTGITLLNQSVLLAGVNDNVATLRGLSEALFEVGILPYYLRLPDRVTGTSHFHVGIDTAVRLHNGIQSSLPGYLVPKLVHDKPGLPAKELITSHSFALTSAQRDALE